MSPTQERDPFVVFGPSKSGTTWLQKLLDTHPDVRCHFQLPMFRMLGAKGLFVPTNIVLNLRKNPFGGVFKDEQTAKNYFARQDFFTHIQLESEKKAKTLMSQNEIPGETVRQWHDNTIKATFNSLLYDTLEKKIFGNKAYTDLETFFRLYPKGKIINIVRDGRDVCVSRRFHTLRMGTYYQGDENPAWLRFINNIPIGRRITRKLHEKTGWFGESHYKNADSKPLFGEGALSKFAGDWKLIMEYILEWQGQRPQQILMVRYENLKTTPETEIKKVLDFIDADASPEIIEEMIAQNSFSKLKKTEQGKSFFRKGVVGDWRNHFTPDDVQLFKQLTGDLLVRLNYETNTDWQ